MTTPMLTDDELPPLPDPSGFVDCDLEFHGTNSRDGNVYTADQMRQAQRDAYALALSRLSAGEPVGRVRVDAARYAAMLRAMGHPRVLEIMADCCDAIEAENDAVAGAPYDGSHWIALARDLRQQAAEIRAEDPELWEDRTAPVPQGVPVGLRWAVEHANHPGSAYLYFDTRENAVAYVKSLKAAMDAEDTAHTAPAGTVQAGCSWADCPHGADCVHATPQAQPSEAARAVQQRTAMLPGDRALKFDIGANWLCLRFNTDTEAEDAAHALTSLGDEWQRAAMSSQREAS